jgi:hypothetical protein
MVRLNVVSKTTCCILAWHWRLEQPDRHPVRPRLGVMDDFTDLENSRGSEHDGLKPGYGPRAGPWYWAIGSPRQTPEQMQCTCSRRGLRLRYDLDRTSGCSESQAPGRRRVEASEEKPLLPPVDRAGGSSCTVSCLSLLLSFPRAQGEAVNFLGANLLQTAWSKL